MSVSELLIRFLLGGTVVSLFAMIAEVVKPKTYAGIFGAAPSVALATLGLTFAKDGSDAAALKTRWMAAATAAMLVYCIACVVLSKRANVPVWAGAAAVWSLWLAVALAIWFLGRGVLA